MAIQIPNPGTGNGASGDNEFVLWSKVKDNFSNQTHAASRLVGTAIGNVLELGSCGVGKLPPTEWTDFLILKNYEGINSAGLSSGLSLTNLPTGFISQRTNHIAFGHPAYPAGIVAQSGGRLAFYCESVSDFSQASYHLVYHTGNVTKDSNGFLKGASPVVDLYDNKIGLNNDAEQQGGIMFEKLGVGDYLVKGSLGFAQEGWYIETPKDANGNVLVAVVYEQLANNDISIKTYAKKFDDETGDIVANLLKPRDIPTGRFISLRLHELLKMPPVMPNESQPEV